jgi:hypothetical protein
MQVYNDMQKQQWAGHTIPYLNTQVSTYDTTSANFVGARRTSTDVGLQKISMRHNVWKASYGQKKSVNGLIWKQT